MEKRERDVRLVRFGGGLVRGQQLDVFLMHVLGCWVM